MTRGMTGAGDSTKRSPAFPVLHTNKVKPRNSLLRIGGWAAPDACKDPFPVTTQVHNRTEKVGVRLKKMTLNSPDTHSLHPKGYPGETILKPR